MNVNVPRHVHAEHFAAEHLRAVDQLSVDDLLFEDPLFVVDVLTEQVEGGDPLDEAALDVGPLVGRDDAGDQVEREDLVGVDREGDALVAEQRVGHPPAALERVGVHVLEPVGHGGVVPARLFRPGEHLVEDLADFIILEHRPSVLARGQLVPGNHTGGGGGRKLGGRPGACFRAVRRLLSETPPGCR